MKGPCLRWGFLGAGRCTHDFISALKLLPQDHHTAVGIASRDAGKAESFAQQLGLTRSYGSYLELVKADDIDIVYIGTVNSEHFPQARMALLHGKHVLCEKPVCINETQAKELVELAREKKLFFMEGFWTFFFPTTKTFLDHLAQGKVGKVLHMTVEIGNRFYHLDRFSRKDIGGGTLLNHGVYGLMFAHKIFGPPTKVQASAALSSTGTDESVAIILGYQDNEQLATIMCSSKADMPGELKVIGTEGTLTLRYPFWAPTTLVNPDGVIEEMQLPNGNVTFNNLNSSGFIYEAEAVRKCIFDGYLEAPELPWNSSLQVMSVVDQIRKQIGVTFDADSTSISNGFH